MAAGLNINKLSRRLLAVTLLSALLFSCQKDETSSNSVLFNGNNTVSYTATQAIINIYSSTSWTISVRYDGSSQEDWCELGQTRGTGDDKVIITFEPNVGTERIAIFDVDFGNEKKSVTLIQERHYDSVNEIVGNWFELPSDYAEPGSGAQVVAHYIPNSSGVRNFTIKYNTELHYPEWVAYPMHTSYFRSGGVRTDKWQYDPKIPQSLQPYLGVPKVGMGNGYDRGHMIPSAARTRDTLANEQTFFYTNMTCQRNKFNGGVWADLEALVRNWSGRNNDTLYVVTGAVLRTVGGNEAIKTTYSRIDPAQLSMPVPNYYYKALLKRYANGNYRGIAFWFDDVDPAEERGPQSTDAISISDLEAKTGLTFFPQLPESVSDEIKNSLKPDEWL